MTFKSHELDFLRHAELGRLATIQPDGTPQNSPVGFTYNESLGTIDIAGYRMSKSQKFRNVAHNARWRSSSTTSPHATRGGCAA
jgi:pyridoxamine 5'-phosphate oxidase family protein